MTCDRRGFIEAVGVSTLFAASRSTAAQEPRPEVATTPATGDVMAWRRRFPALSQLVNGHPLAYLDSAATTLRPRQVIDAQSRFYETANANPGAVLHTLARRAAEHYSGARNRVAQFLHASDPLEVIFTKGTTDGINLVAATWGVANIHRGDEIVSTIAEHYSNLLPWRALANRVGARIRTVDVDDDGRLSPARIREALTPRTKLIAFSQVSNVLGLVSPVDEICAVARAHNVPVLVDAAQSAPHLRLDVQALGCDFLACSGHKMLGPMGVGVLWVRRAVLETMPAYQWGSNMAHEVDATAAELERGALRYQAGTPNVSGAVGLAAALDVLDDVGLERLKKHDTLLVEHARARLARVPQVRILGTMSSAATRLPVLTFVVPGIPVARLVRALDAQGVAVRGGDMAALPLLRRFGLREAARASCYLYTTTDEIDRLADVLAIEAKR